MGFAIKLRYVEAVEVWLTVVGGELAVEKSLGETEAIIAAGNDAIDTEAEFRLVAVPVDRAIECQPVLLQQVLIGPDNARPVTRFPSVCVAAVKELDVQPEMLMRE